MPNNNLDFVLDQLPGSDAGFFWKGLHEIANGDVSVTKKKTIRIPIEISLEELGPKHFDVRAVLPPYISENKIVPLIVFIDPAIASDFYLKQKKSSIAQPVADERAITEFVQKLAMGEFGKELNGRAIALAAQEVLRRAALCQPAEEKKPHEWSTLRRGYFDVFNDDGTVYATVFNSLEALSYLENGWRVEEQKPGQPAEEGGKS